MAIQTVQTIQQQDSHNIQFGSPVSQVTRTITYESGNCNYNTTNFIKNERMHARTYTVEMSSSHLESYIDSRMTVMKHRLEHLLEKECEPLIQDKEILNQNRND